MHARQAARIVRVDGAVLEPPLRDRRLADLALEAGLHDENACPLARPQDGREGRGRHLADLDIVVVQALSQDLRQERARKRSAHAILLEGQGCIDAPRSAGSRSRRPPSGARGSRPSRGPAGRAAGCATTEWMTGSQLSASAARLGSRTDLVVLQRLEQDAEQRADRLERRADARDERKNSRALLLKLGRIAQLAHLEDLGQQRQHEGKARRAVEVRQAALDAVSVKLGCQRVADCMAARSGATLTSAGGRVRACRTSTTGRAGQTAAPHATSRARRRVS